MILIISNNIDNWTNRVIERLYFGKYDCLRINSYHDISAIKLKLIITNKHTSLRVNSRIVRKIWVRKKPTWIVDNLPYCEIPQVAKFYTSELDALYSFILCASENSSYIIGHSHYNNMDINKLYVLYSASSYGIDIPKTLVTNSTKEAEVFEKNNGELIIKPISNCISYFDKEQNIMFKMFTSAIDWNYFGGKVLFPTMFQEKLKKKTELRVFYFYGVFKSIRIYTQSNINPKSCNSPLLI